MKKNVAVVAILSVFTLAISFILIGAVSVELKARLSIGNAQIGALTFTFFLTCMGVQLLVGLLVDRFGHKPIAVAGFLSVSLSIFLLAYVRTLALTKLATVFLGCGAICCNTVGNTLLPVVLFDGREPARASNLGNGFVGLAFILVPLSIVTLIGLGWSYSLTLSVIAGLVLSFAIFALIPAYPAVATGFAVSKALRLLRRPAVLVGGLALLCYLGLEIGISTWIRTLMTDLAGGANNPAAVRNAGWVLSLFGLAMAVGRFASSSIKNLTKIGCQVVVACTLAAMLGIGVLIKATDPWVAAVAVIMIGLSLAPIFATIVGITFAQFEPDLYGSIFGIIFSVGLIGPAFLPRVIGILSVSRTVQQSLPVALGVGAILIALALIMGGIRKGTEQEKTGAQSVPESVKAT